MATQAIPTLDTLRQRPVALVPRSPSPTRRTLPVHVAPSPRGESKAQQKQRLLVEMLPMVKRVAFSIREHLPSHVELDDLVANGVVGLVDAVARFDSSKRVKLESYARHRVRGGILDGLRSADPASRDLRRKNKRVQKLYRELEVKLGRPVHDDEMAAAMGLSVAQWHRTLNEIQSVGFDSTGRMISAGPTSKPLSRIVEPSILADDRANPFDLCYRREQRMLLGRALSCLRERERQIINLYYFEELTMKQIAERLRVDESRVSQLHSAAITRLKSNVSGLLNPRAPAKVSKYMTAAAR